jgi:hypothetical protein
MDTCWIFRDSWFLIDVRAANRHEKKSHMQWDMYHLASTHQDSLYAEQIGFERQTCIVPRILSWSPVLNGLLGYWILQVAFQA